MAEMDKYYQILGVHSEASEEEIRLAYRDMVKVWHPDRFPNNERLREKANEKIKEINEAYEILKFHLAWKAKESASESQPSLDPTRPKPWVWRSSPAHVSWKLLALFFAVLGFRIGGNLNHEVIGAISGLLMGVGIGILINRLDKTRKYKIKVAWGVALAGLLLFLILSGLTTSEHTRSTSFLISSLYQRLISSFSKPPVDPDAERKEAQKIGFVFEYIRQANLQKDIDLFMSCFSRDFDDKEGKRQDTLKMWETFNYQDLSYEVKELTLLGNTAHARLEWVVIASDTLGGKLHNGTTHLDVGLRKEEDCWKIASIKQASNPQAEVPKL
jgi:hypothetical protein